MQLSLLNIVAFWPSSAFSTPQGAYLGYICASPVDGRNIAFRLLHWDNYSIRTTVVVEQIYNLSLIFVHFVEEGYSGTAHYFDSIV